MNITQVLKVFFWLFIVVTSTVNAQFKNLPNIKILATGGTIAGSSSSAFSSSYSAGQIGIKTMMNAIPEVKKIANVSGEQVSNVGSQDMTFNIWFKLANRINELLREEDVDGIVVTHGTDTQEETAYFLSLVIKSDKPVVLTGAMRSSTSISAEGPLNLFNAIAIAANEKARGKGVLVALNDQIHGARDVSKMNTTSVNSFQSPIKGLLGGVFYGKLGFFRVPNTKFGVNSEFSLKNLTKLPRVDIIYGCADMSSDLIDIHVKAGAKGIIIAGVGNGNMTEAILNAAKRAYEEDGIVVVRSTKAATGWVLRDNEFIDSQYHTVVSHDLSPSKSRILLMLALTKQKKLEEIQQLFYTY